MKKWLQVTAICVLLSLLSGCMLSERALKELSTQLVGEKKEALQEAEGETDTAQPEVEAQMEADPDFWNNLTVQEKTELNRLLTYYVNAGNPSLDVEQLTDEDMRLLGLRFLVRFSEQYETGDKLVYFEDGESYGFTPQTLDDITRVMFGKTVQNHSSSTTAALSFGGDANMYYFYWEDIQPTFDALPPYGFAQVEDGTDNGDGTATFKVHVYGFDAEGYDFRPLAFWANAENYAREYYMYEGEGVVANPKNKPTLLSYRMVTPMDGVQSMVFEADEATAAATEAEGKEAYLATLAYIEGLDARAAAAKGMNDMQDAYFEVFQAWATELDRIETLTKQRLTQAEQEAFDQAAGDWYMDMVEVTFEMLDDSQVSAIENEKYMANAYKKRTLALVDAYFQN